MGTRVGCACEYTWVQGWWDVHVKTYGYKGEMCVTAHGYKGCVCACVCM